MQVTETVVLPASGVPTSEAPDTLAPKFIVAALIEQAAVTVIWTAKDEVAVAA